MTSMTFSDPCAFHSTRHWPFSLGAGSPKFENKSHNRGSYWPCQCMDGNWNDERMGNNSDARLAKGNYEICLSILKASMTLDWYMQCRFHLLHGDIQYAALPLSACAFSSRAQVAPGLLYCYMELHYNYRVGHKKVAPSWHETHKFLYRECKHKYPGVIVIRHTW